jgi:polyhydroxyalkanoate synthesis regulator protein
MSEQASIVIKRYGADRLYEPAKARYVTPDELRAWRRNGMPVSVRDANTGEDVTLAVLAEAGRTQ